MHGAVYAAITACRCPLPGPSVLSGTKTFDASLAGLFGLGTGRLRADGSTVLAELRAGSAPTNHSLPAPKAPGALYCLCPSRSEEHTSASSDVANSDAVFCFKIA